MNSFFYEWFLMTFLLILILVIVSLVVWSLKNGISPMPTSPKVKSDLFSLLPAEIKGKIYELGSGWGIFVIPLARRFSMCQVIGFETSPIPYWISILWLKIIKISNAVFIRRDFFSVDLAMLH